MNTWGKRGLSIVLAACLAVSLFTVPAFAESEEPPRERHPLALPFADVPLDSWFYTAVLFVYTEGVMTGMEERAFTPNATLSRAMVVATLFRVHNGRLADERDSRQTPFHDVLTGDWFAPYVSWAAARGIVDGVGGGRFAPEGYVSRQQFATMLYRFVSSTTGEDMTVGGTAQWEAFTDRAQTAAWALDALIWANDRGLITGRTDTTIVPEGTATRAEAAMVLTRFLGGPTGPLRVDLADLMGKSFIDVWFLFGNVRDMIYHIDGSIYAFDTGLLVDFSAVVNRVAVNFAFEGSQRFHLGGLDGDSTRQELEARFGSAVSSRTFMDPNSNTERRIFHYAGEHGRQIAVVFSDPQAASARIIYLGLDWERDFFLL